MVQVSAKAGKPEYFKTDVLVIGLFDGDKLNEDQRRIDGLLSGEISKLLKNKDFVSKFGQVQSLSTLGKLRADRVLVVSMGKKADYELELLRKAGAIAARIAEALGAKDVTSLLHALDEGPIPPKARAITEGAILGLYKFNKYMTEKKEGLQSFTHIDRESRKVPELEYGLKMGKILAEAANYTRDITNTPAKDMTPIALASEALKVGRETGVKVRVFDKNAIEKMGMNALLAVSKGSEEDPRFIVMEYIPVGKPKKTVAIVGKGITFDSGGLDLKPARGMEDMKYDKSGAAAVLGAMKTVSKLKPPIRVIGVIAATENMPGGGATKPGDIVTAYNKKTIEIVNTDAEGRLVLADALSYTEKTYQPDYIVDLATLTGIILYCLGPIAAGVMGNNDEFVQKLIKAGQDSSERVWQLPLWKEYLEMPKGDIADLKNVAKGSAIEPGAIYGAAFLKNFVEKPQWAHLDIGGTAWSYEDHDYVIRGATGYGVRLVTQLILNLAEELAAQEAAMAPKKKK